jgi:hypothetical protein
MLSVILLSVIILSVVMLSVNMLSVMAPFAQFKLKAIGGSIEKVIKVEVTTMVFNFYT